MKIKSATAIGFHQSPNGTVKLVFTYVLHILIYDLRQLIALLENHGDGFVFQFKKIRPHCFIVGNQTTHREIEFKSVELAIDFEKHLRHQLRSENRLFALRQLANERNFAEADIFSRGDMRAVRFIEPKRFDHSVDLSERRFIG